MSKLLSILSSKHVNNSSKFPAFLATVKHFLSELFFFGFFTVFIFPNYSFILAQKTATTAAKW